jgi:hypothetical protein
MALVGGCGGSSHAGPGPKPRGDAAVIRAWADTLRAGDVAGAAHWFGVPAVVQNGTPPITLRTPAAVRLFNDSLPCGAVLVHIRVAGPYTVGIFKLTNRPGGDCGNGVGAAAATAFRIRSGKIVEWRRVEIPQEENAPPSQSV